MGCDWRGSALGSSDLGRRTFGQLDRLNLERGEINLSEMLDLSRERHTEGHTPLDETRLLAAQT